MHIYQLTNQANEDNEWFEKHKEEFVKRAQHGDETFQELLDQNRIKR